MKPATNRQARKGTPERPPVVAEHDAIDRRDAAERYLLAHSLLPAILPAAEHCYALLAL